MGKRRAWRALAIAAGLSALTSTVATAAPSSTAAQAVNPFTSQDVFCTKSPAPAGTRNASAPGVTPTSINITDMSIDAAVLRRFGTDLQDFNAAFKAFWGEVNRCGGINGRTINLRTAKYNLAAPDLSGHLQSLCLKATEDQKAFVVVGTGPPQVQRCVSIAHKSIMVASTGVLSSEFAESKGRIISITPSGEAAASVFIDDAAKQGVFKGRSVGVLGANNTSTAAADQQRQYVDYLKKKDVDVADFEVLPCSGTVCTSGLTTAVSRMKSKGVDLIVLTHQVSVTTLGSIWRELRSQGLKAPMYNTFTDSLNGDSTLGGMVRTAGSDGAQYAESVGWYTTKLYDVHNNWRIGGAKETPFAKMCTATLAKANNERRYLYNEQDISNGRWGGTVNICQQVRGIAQALWSLGSNVTTERMVTALKNLKAVDRWDTSPAFRDKLFFSDRDVSPTKAMTAKFAFPCPLPRVTPGEACFLPVDRPARVRNV